MLPRCTEPQTLNLLICVLFLGALVKVAKSACYFPCVCLPVSPSVRISSAPSAGFGVKYDVEVF
jgi:hypothetical protein